MTLAKFSLTGEPVVLHRHISAQMHSCLRRFSLLWALTPSSLLGCSCSLLTSSSLTPPLWAFFLCLCHKCQNSASSRKPAVVLAAEINRLAHWFVSFTFDGVTCLWLGNLTSGITGFNFPKTVRWRSYLADRSMGRLSIRWRGSQRSLSCREAHRGEWPQDELNLHT